METNSERHHRMGWRQRSRNFVPSGACAILINRTQVHSQSAFRVSLASRARLNWEQDGSKVRGSGETARCRTKLHARFGDVLRAWDPKWRKAFRLDPSIHLEKTTNAVPDD